MRSVIPPEVVGILNSQGITVIDFSPAAGGCINNGGRLTTSNRDLFLKWNLATTFPGMFEAEARGLKLLSGTNTFTIPEVISHNAIGEYQYLLLSYVNSQPKNPYFWLKFGRKLAELHLHSNTYFGLAYNNYIGSLEQVNHPVLNGIEFFIEKRLKVQLNLALNNNLVDTGIVKNFEKLFLKLPSLLTDERPALIHGDLWSGNLMVDENGNPCLIDPAVCYANREADLAMTTLFGGFDVSYVNEYNTVYPLPPGYKERLEIYKLYPLLVHVNLFGRSYLNQVVSILNYFV
ncbi:fructosamine kinase family protein [Chryseosolibacter indicus]|uniref:Fructosamine kinase family protein n=1 Tax=Chryseosolibacter indicus TaxID=2782351 RepID=A0ABS5VQK9_9BACT|nr:fructosamine kinase family protein [Chryseosolibacter indicus]